MLTATSCTLWRASAKASAAERYVLRGTRRSPCGRNETPVYLQTRLVAVVLNVVVDVKLPLVLTTLT